MEFKIISEAIVYLCCQDELFLMLIKQRNDYFIEVDSRTARIGKRQVRSRREGNVVFGQMQTSLNRYGDLWSSNRMLELAYRMATIHEHMFIVNNLNMEVEFNSIWKMKRLYGCQTTPVNTDVIFESDEFKRSIHITFPNRERPIGFFKAPNNDSKFLFYLNEDFFVQG